MVDSQLSKTVLLLSYKRNRDSQQMAKCCKELYSHESCRDNAVLQSAPEKDLQLILHEEVEIAVELLKKRESLPELII